jgi:hypothetical protein
MGKPSTSKLNDACSQTCCRGQEKDDEPGSQEKALSQVKGLLGPKEIRQEVIFVIFRSDLCKLLIP